MCLLRLFQVISLPMMEELLLGRVYRRLLCPRTCTGRIRRHIEVYELRPSVGLVPVFCC